MSPIYYGDIRPGEISLLSIGLWECVLSHDWGKQKRGENEIYSLVLKILSFKNLNYLKFL